MAARRRGLVVWMVLVCVVGSARADAPKLVKSVPADGAKDVPLDVGAIRLEFDREMDRKAWTLWRSSKGALPPFVDTMADPWQDARTCALDLKKLKPDTTYALQLNSARRQGFRSAKGKAALPVTVIAFRTVGVKKKAPPATKPATLTAKPAATKKLVVPDGPVGVAVGWQLSGTRKIHRKQDRKIGDDPVRAATIIQELAFTEKVVKVEDGRAREVTRELTRADIQQTNPRTGKLEKGVICKLPVVFRVAGEDGNDVTDAKTGKAVSEGLAEAVGGTLAPDLWPEKGKLTQGREWTYKGRDLSRRLAFIGARGGKMTLKVERIVALAGTDLAVAQIRGTLETQVELEVMMDFDGTVEIDLPIAIGIPSRISFSGDLSAKGTAKDDAGKEITYAITGRGGFEQTAEASDAVIAAAAGKKVKTQPKKEPTTQPTTQPTKPRIGKERPIPRSDQSVVEVMRTDKGTLRTLVLSADASRYFAVAQDGEKRTAFFNGAELTGCANTGSHIYDASRSHYAVVAHELSGKQSMVVDGKPLWPCDQVGYPPIATVFSRDGKHFACAYKTDKKWRVCVGGAPGPAYDWVGYIAMSANGKHVAYVVKEGKEYSVMRDGKRAGPRFDDIHDLVMSDDGKTSVCRARKGDKWQVLVDGKPGRKYSEILSLALSRDGKRLVFIAKNDAGSFVLVDRGRQSTGYARVDSVALSPDGKKVLFVASDSSKGAKWYLVVDGKKIPAEREYIYLDSLAFSPDGKRMGYAVRSVGMQAAVIDGKRGPISSLTSAITFSPDGKHAAYRRVHRDGEAIVLDGQEQKTYGCVSEPVFTKPVFTRPAQLVYLAAKGGVLYRVRTDLKPAAK